MTAAITFLGMFALIIGSIVAHEIAHGYVASWLGDDTARVNGRLSLNPLKHLDPIGSFLVPILLLLSGTGIFFGWAKPVPIDPSNFADPRVDRVKVGLAGPATNAILALIAAGLFHLAAPINAVVAQWLVNAVLINTTLALFNLLPLPPLDGSSILGILLPESVADAIDSINPFITFLLLIILINTGLVSAWLDHSVGAVSRILLGQ